MTTTSDGCRPNGVQLDLLTVVARLHQLNKEKVHPYHAVEIAFFDGTVLDRILTCDLPRLEKHLTPETIAWMDEVEEGWRSE